MISSFQLLIFITFWVKGLLGDITVSQSPPVIAVQPGDNVQIICRASQDINKYMSLYQFKPGQTPKLLVYHGTSLFSGTPTRFSGSRNGAEFTFTITQVQIEDEAEYHCGQNYQRPYTFGAQTKLTVGTPPTGQTQSSPVVSMLTPSHEEMASAQKATLICLVNGFSPDPVSVSWTVDGRSAPGEQQDSQSVRSSDKTYSMSSALVLSRSAWESGEVFTCAVQHKSLQAPVTQSIRRSQCLSV